MKAHTWTISLALLGLLACDSKSTTTAPLPTTGSLPSSTPTTLATTSSTQPTTAPAEATRLESASHVGLTKSLAVACQVDGFFDYDPAEPRSAGARRLDQLADCLTRGALRGRSLEIFGHADERNDARYLQRFGHSRAQSVASYLVGKGVEEARMKVVARLDPDDARPGDDAHRLDHERRVTLKLGA